MLSRFWTNAKVSWQTTTLGVLAFLITNEKQIFIWIAYLRGVIADPGSLDKHALLNGILMMLMGATARDADKPSVNHCLVPFNPPTTGTCAPKIVSAILFFAVAAILISALK